MHAIVIETNKTGSFFELFSLLILLVYSLLILPLIFIKMGQDSEVVNMCLRALRALASYHYRETAAGKVGLGSHASDPRNPSGGTENSIFGRFLRSLLQFLLLEDYR